MPGAAHTAHAARVWPDDTASLRLLSCNIFAGARVDRYRHYVTRSLSQVFPRAEKQLHLDELAAIITDYDLVGLQESDAGSLRSGFRNQTEYLAQSAHMPYWSHQPNRRVGQMAASSNGLISRLQPNAVFDHPLPGRIPGRGVLVAEFGRAPDNLAVLVAHLSLGNQARARQFAFIAELLQDYRDAILMGDLNCDIHNRGIDWLLQHTRLQAPPSITPTFPSWRPHRAIDHILATESIAIDHIRALNAACSDHLPLAATATLPLRLAALQPAA